MNCPNADILKNLALGKLDDDQVDEIEEHLLGCPNCQNRLIDIERKYQDSLLHAIRKAENATNPSVSVKYFRQRNVKEIDGFRIVKKIGAGATGNVFEAIDEKTGEARAVKILHSSKHFDPSAFQRFQREKEIVSKLDHPNVVKSYPANDPTLIVMERLVGTDLSDLVKSGGPLSVEQVCDIIVQAATGLQYAHEQGIVHRDIKPSNLFLTSSGKIDVLDLGLARLLETPQNTASTQTGQVVGTPEFISPEQAVDPKNLDGRSDIYSLGCTFFYLLTGQSPFGGQHHPTVVAKLAAHVKDKAPNVRTLRPDVPPTIAAIVEKMLEKEPDRRFQSMSELIEAIRNPKSIAAKRFSLSKTFLFLIAFALLFSVFWGSRFYFSAHKTENMVERNNAFADEIQNSKEHVDDIERRQDESDSDEPICWNDPINIAFALTVEKNGKTILEFGRHSELTNMIRENEIEFPGFTGVRELTKNSNKKEKHVYSFSNLHQDCSWLSDRNPVLKNIKTATFSPMTNSFAYTSFMNGAQKTLDFPEEVRLPFYAEFSLYDWYGDEITVILSDTKNRTIKLKIIGNGVSEDGEPLLKYDFSGENQAVFKSPGTKIGIYSKQEMLFKQDDQLVEPIKISLDKDEHSDDIRLNYLITVFGSEEVNLVKNGSFEEGYMLRRDGWEYQHVRNDVYFDTSSDAKEGNTSATIESQNGGGGVWRQFVPIEPNTQYTFSVWYKLDNVQKVGNEPSGMNICVDSGAYRPPNSGGGYHWKGRGADHGWIFPKPFTGTTGWKKFEQTIETGPGDDHLFIGLRLGVLENGEWRTAKGKIYFDDVRVVKIETSK